VIAAILDAGKHRAWVVDEEGRPQSLITLTDIIRKLLEL
jgi:CBS domain containing-hemolysin-like protein